MNNRYLFSQPGAEMPRRRVPCGPDREIFRPEWEVWTVLAQTAEGGKRK